MAERVGGRWEERHGASPSDRSGVQLTMTRRGVEISGWYDTYVGIEYVFLSWDDFDAMRERVMNGESFRRVIAAEGRRTDDDRLIAPGALRWSWSHDRWWRLRTPAGTTWMETSDETEVRAEHARHPEMTLQRLWTRTETEWRDA